jgi:methionine-rich copper-binding protein CopC
MTVSWTNGDGDRRVVFMKQADSGTATPVDGTSYTANAAFASGDQIASTGWYAIYNGFGTSVTVTNLAAATDYIFQVFEYNGVGDSAEDYMAASATNNPKVQASYTPTIVYTNYNTGDDDAGDGSLETPYKTFTKAYAEAIPGDTIDLTGTFTWTNADETGDQGYSNWLGFEITKDLTIQGQGAGETIVQSAATAYGSTRIFAIRDNASTTIRDLTIRHGYASSAGTYDDGGCIYAQSGTNLTIDRADLHSCQTWGYSGYGAIIAAYSTTTITNSSIHDGDGNGAGIYFSANGKTLNITNSTIYNNGDSSLDNGGGIYVYAGTVNLTNTTVTGNNRGSGIYLYNSSSVFLNLKNSIVADNYTYYNYNDTLSNIYKGSSATVTSNGYNVVGDNLNDSYFTATTGDWTDTDGDGIYNLYSIGTTGDLNLDTEAAYNDNPHYTYTYRLLADSIAINNATTNTHGAINIPTTDQRSGARVGDTDIGAFEYEANLADITVPSLSYLNPSDNATGVAVDAIFEIAFDEAIATSTGNIILYKTSDDSVIETIDVGSSKITASSTTALLIDPASTLEDEIEYYWIIEATAIDDIAGNSYTGITASTTWSFTTIDGTAPTIISISSDKANGDYTTGEVIDIDVIFSEAVTSTGDVTVTLETGDTDQTCTFTVSSASTGTCNYTVQAGDTSADLNASISGTIKDGADNILTNFTPTTGLADNKALVIDTTAPTATLTPLDEAVDVAINNSLTLSFDEVVDAESGNITIYKTSDDSIVEAIDVTGDLVSGVGTAEIVVEPTADLEYETEYYVWVDATAFDDSAGNSYIGITASTTWSFITAGTPTCPTIAHTATYNAYPACGVATCEDGYNLTDGACVSASGGAAVAAPVASGEGSVSTSIGMGESINMGQVQSTGMNVMGYINSSATFDTVVSNKGKAHSENHRIEIVGLDLLNNIITIIIYSEPKEIILNLDEIAKIDLDNDNVEDLEIKFEDIYVNRVELTVKSLLEESVDENYENRLIKYNDSSKVYLIEKNNKRWIEDEETFNFYKYNWSDVLIIPDDIIFEDGLNLDKDSGVNHKFENDLKLGAMGKDVQKLQQYLNRHGFELANSGIGSIGQETEYFGPLTKKALVNFQIVNNLPAYGFFGPMTRCIVNR